MLDNLLDQVGAYLGGCCSLSSLENWLVLHLQDILDSRDERAIAVANGLDADFVEFREGLINMATVRERMNELIRSRDTVTLCLNDMEPHAITLASAAAETLTSRFVATGSVENYSLDHVFA